VTLTPGGVQKSDPFSFYSQAKNFILSSLTKQDLPIGQGIHVFSMLNSKIVKQEFTQGKIPLDKLLHAQVLVALI
jgi:hypothetical protein